MCESHTVDLGISSLIGPSQTPDSRIILPGGSGERSKALTEWHHQLHPLDYRKIDTLNFMDSSN